MTGHYPDITTKVNRNQVISRYEAEQRRQEREAAKLRDLLCPYCERRRFDGNRFDRCYWCNLILKDGFNIALETRPERPLAGFSTAPERRNTVVNDVLVHPTRFNNP